jgi:hypothetical protein
MPADQRAASIGTSLRGAARRRRSARTRNGWAIETMLVATIRAQTTEMRTRCGRKSATTRDIGTGASASWARSRGSMVMAPLPRPPRPLRAGSPSRPVAARGSWPFSDAVSPPAARRLAARRAAQPSLGRACRGPAGRSVTSTGSASTVFVWTGTSPTPWVSACLIAAVLTRTSCHGCRTSRIPSPRSPRGLPLAGSFCRRLATAATGAQMSSSAASLSVRQLVSQTHHESNSSSAAIIPTWVCRTGHEGTPPPHSPTVEPRATSATSSCAWRAPCAGAAPRPWPRGTSPRTTLGP